jgi:hypothetical protein
VTGGLAMGAHDNGPFLDGGVVADYTRPGVVP